MRKVIATGLLGGLLMGFLIGSVKAQDDQNRLTCADVRAVVAIIGEKEAERAARAAGASDEAIARAKRCLRS